MSRSIWKPDFLHNQYSEQQGHDEIYLVNRATRLTEEMVGQRIQVYNGIRFLPLQVNTDMVGHLVGEFAPTRKRSASKKAKKK
jgi:ribosomal protein S19